MLSTPVFLCSVGFHVQSPCGDVSLPACVWRSCSRNGGRYRSDGRGLISAIVYCRRPPTVLSSRYIRPPIGRRRPPAPHLTNTASDPRPDRARIVHCRPCMGSRHSAAERAASPAPCACAFLELLAMESYILVRSPCPSRPSNIAALTEAGALRLRTAADGPPALMSLRFLESWNFENLYSPSKMVARYDIKQNKTVEILK